MKQILFIVIILIIISLKLYSNDSITNSTKYVNISEFVEKLKQDPGEFLIILENEKTILTKEIHSKYEGSKNKLDKVISMIKFTNRDYYYFSDIVEKKNITDKNVTYIYYYYSITEEGFKSLQIKTGDDHKPTISDLDIAFFFKMTENNTNQKYLNLNTYEFLGLHVKPFYFPEKLLK